MSLIKPRTATVTIYGGNYLDEIRHLEARARAAKEAADGTPVLLTEEPEYVAIAAEHDRLVAEAEASAVHLVVQALPRKVWTALRLAHPPRTRDDVDPRVVRTDALIGVNEDTFKDALVLGGTIDVDGRATAYRSVVEPSNVTVEDLEELSSADFDRVYLTAFGLNRSTEADPKASLVSRLTQTSDETSN